MKKICLLSILALVMMMVSCSEDAGGSSGGTAQPAKPPVSPGGPGGVWVDTDGSLKIQATIYIVNEMNGQLVPATVFNGRTISAHIRDYHNSTQVDSATISNGEFSLTIPVPPDALLVKASNSEFSEVLTSGHDVEVGSLELYIDYSPWPGPSINVWLRSNISIKMEIHGGIPYIYADGDDTGYVYSKGDVSCFGNERDDYYGEAYHVDMKLTQGWNVLTQSAFDNGNVLNITMISQNPPNDAIWVCYNY